MRKSMEILFLISYLLWIICSDEDLTNREDCTDLSIYHKNTNCTQRFMLYIGIIGLPTLKDVEISQTFESLMPLFRACIAAEKANPQDQSNFFILGAKSCDVTPFKQYNNIRSVNALRFDATLATTLEHFIDSALNFPETCHHSMENVQSVLLLVLKIPSGNLLTLLKGKYDIIWLRNLMKRVVDEDFVIKVIFNAERSRIELDSNKVEEAMNNIRNLTENYISYVIDSLQNYEAVSTNYGLCTPQPLPTFAPVSRQPQTEHHFVPSAPMPQKSKKWIWGVVVGGIVLLVIIGCAARPLYRYLQRLWYKWRLDDQDLYAVVRKDQIFATVNPNQRQRN